MWGVEISATGGVGAVENGPCGGFLEVTVGNAPVLGQDLWVFVDWLKAGLIDVDVALPADVLSDGLTVELQHRVLLEKVLRRLREVWVVG